MLLFFFLPLQAQTDTNYLRAVYDRCLDFSEDKADSVLFYANLIEKESARLNYDKGRVLFLRLRGLAADLNFEYEKAIDYYFQSLDEARRLQAPNYQIAALSDLAILYANIKQPQKAKEFYVQCLPLMRRQGDLPTLVTTHTNLAAIYTRLSQYDSALALLNENLSFEKKLPGDVDLSTTYNNIGNIYFLKKEFDAALPFFLRNLREHSKDTANEKQWLDHLNLADVYIELKKFDTARLHVYQALEWAQRLRSKSKEADTYSLLAKFYEKLGDFNKAYEYLKQWYALDTSLVNAETNNSIASLQERYNAKEREAENKLLLASIEREKYRNQDITVIAFALGAMALLAAMAFVTKRNANRKLQEINNQIRMQKKKLEELNREKNALIGIVSHDLSAPFSSIHVWGEVLESDTNQLSEEQAKALSRIRQAGKHGEQLIRNILDIERSDIGQHQLNIEQVNLTRLAAELLDNFGPAAKRKQIQIIYENQGEDIQILSDPQLLRRIIENLLSNALKFTNACKNIYLSVADTGSSIKISVKDEGIGIPPADIQKIFFKYSQVSSRPTGNESSHGMGLSIVKRMVDELNGEISCQSEPGKGSLFTVLLPK